MMKMAKIFKKITLKIIIKLFYRNFESKGAEKAENDAPADEKSKDDAEPVSFIKLVCKFNEIKIRRSIYRGVGRIYIFFLFNYS